MYRISSDGPKQAGGQIRFQTTRLYLYLGFLQFGCVLVNTLLSSWVSVQMQCLV